MKTSKNIVKGFVMELDEIRNPENYKNRIVVAFDANNQGTPRKYILLGHHNHENEHLIRRMYSKSTGVNYYDTRVVLLSTYTKRVASNRVATV